MKKKRGKNVLRRALGLLLSFVLVFSMIPSVVFADDDPFQNVDTGTTYPTLQEAVDNANDGQTIKMLSDATIASGVIINKSITLDGNGKTLSGLTEYGSPENVASPDQITDTNVRGLYIKNGDVTIKDLNMTQFGDTEYVNKFGIVPILTATNYAGNLSLENVNIDKFNRQAICVFGGTLTMDGGTINGNATNKAVGDHFQQGIEIRGGDATITGVTVRGMGSNLSYSGIGIVSWSTGDVVLENVDVDVTGIGVEPDYNTVTIKGANTSVKGTDKALFVEDGGILLVKAGTYTGDLAVDTGYNSKIVVTGGTFDRAVDQNFCAEGYVVRSTGSGQYAVETATDAITDNSEDITDLENRVDALETAATTMAGNIADLDSDVAALKDAVGNADSGLVKDVNALDDAINNETTGINKQLSDINGEITAIKTTLSTLATEEDLEALEARVETVEGRLDNVRDYLTNQLAPAIRSLRTQVQTNTADIATLKERAAALETRATALETAVGNEESGLIKDFNDLKAAVGDEDEGLIKDVNDLDDAINNTETGLIVTMNAVKSEIYDENTGILVRLEALETGSATEEDIEELWDEIEIIEGTLETAIGVLASVSTDVNALKTQVQANTEDIAALKTQATNLQSQISTLAAYIRDLVNEVESPDSPADGLLARMTALESEINDEEDGILARLNALEEDYVTEEELGAAIAGIEEEIATLRSDLRSYLSTLKNSLQGQINVLDGRIDELEAWVEEAETEYATHDEVDDKISEARQAIEDAQAAVDAAQNELIQGNTDYIDAVKQACKSYIIALKQADEAIYEYIDEIAAVLQSEIDDLQSQIDGLDEFYATDEELADAIDDLQEQINDLQGQIDDLDEIYATDADIDELKTMIATLRSDVEASEEQLLQTAKDYADGLKEELDDKIDDLQGQIDSLDLTYATDDEVEEAIETATLTIQALQAVRDADQDTNIQNNTTNISRLFNWCKQVRDALELADEATLLAANAYTDAACEQLQLQINANKEMIDALEESKATKEELEAAKTAIETAQEAVDEAQDLRAQGNYDLLNAKIEAAKTSLEAADDEILRLAKAYTDEVKAALKTKIAENRVLINGLQDQINNLGSTYATDEELTTAISNARSEIEAAQREVDAAQNAALTENVAEIMAAFTRARAALISADAETLRAAKAYTDLKAEELQGKIDDNTTLINALAEVAATKEGVAEDIAAAKAQIEQVQAAKDALQDAELEATATELMAAITAAETELRAADLMILSLANQYTDEIAEALTEKINANTAAINSLDETYATDIAVANAIQDATNAIQAAQAEVDAMQDANLQTSVTKLANAIRKVNADLEIADAEVLAAAMAYTDVARRELQAQIDANTTAIATLDSTYATDQQVADAIQQAVDNIERVQRATDALQDVNLLMNVTQINSRIRIAVEELEAADEATLRAAKTYADTIRDELQAQITENKKRLDNLDDTYATDEEVIRAINMAKMEIWMAQRAIDAAQDKAVAESVEELTASIVALNEALAAAIEELEAADEATLLAAKAYTDAKVAMLQEQIDQSRENEEALQLEIDELTEELKQTFADNINVSMAVTPKSYNQVEASWDTSKITVDDAHVSYALYYRQADSYEWIKVCDMECDGKGTPLSFTIGNLLTGTEYNFKIVPTIVVDEEEIKGSESVVLSAKTSLKKASIKKISKGKKKLTVKINKVSGASGYQIKYRLSTSPSQKKVYTTSTSKTIKKLKAKKLYEVKVRAYRTVNGTKVYGAWSGIKYQKTK